MRLDSKRNIVKEQYMRMYQFDDKKQQVILNLKSWIKIYKYHALPMQIHMHGYQERFCHTLFQNILQQ